MGLSLDKEFAEMIAPAWHILNKPKPKIHDVQGRRLAMASFTEAGTPDPIPEGTAQEILSVPAEDGFGIPLWRVSRKPGTEPMHTKPGPAVLYMHGGGFVALGVETFARKLHALVLASGVTIYAVNYRLAPEHPYPTPLEDCWTSLQYIRDHAATLGVDVARIAVMGDSAGGNLAAGVTLLGRHRGITPPIASQFLIYPMLDDRNKEKMEVGVVTLWDQDDNATGWTAYLGAKAGGDEVPVYAAPGRLTDAAGLPRLTLYVGQLDLFVKENVRYALLFLEAGIETELRVLPGLLHGFDELAKDLAASKECFALQVKFMERLLEN
ncbi:Carboxylesterase NlhH [Beauveria bassiana]|nr:Carboxylesterase NlhH [Beauveria bassiana]KAH8711503.1 Carboxylesterase NlhH [Beauveria bassiana]